MGCERRTLCKHLLALRRFDGTLGKEGERSIYATSLNEERYDEIMIKRRRK